MLNWKPVVKSLADELEKEGFEPLSVWYGDEPVKSESWDVAVENVCAVDEATIVMSHPDEDRKKWVFIVLGNAPQETLCDYTVNERIDRAADAHIAMWEGRECPRK